MAIHPVPNPFVGIIIGGIPYRIRLQYPGDVFYPKGPWYDIPELVANLEENVVMRYRASSPRPFCRLSCLEIRMFRNAEDITDLQNNLKELKRIKNGQRKKV